MPELVKHRRGFLTIRENLVKQPLFFNPAGERGCCVAQLAAAMADRLASIYGTEEDK